MIYFATNQKNTKVKVLNISFFLWILVIWSRICA